MQVFSDSIGIERFELSDPAGQAGGQLGLYRKLQAQSFADFLTDGPAMVPIDFNPLCCHGKTQAWSGPAGPVLADLPLPQARRRED